MATERPTSQFERPSLTQKALVSLLGGLGIFAAVNIYDVAATTHNYRAEDARAQKDQEARIFDITRAKVVKLVNLDEQNQPEDEVR